jgi:hypothetical protein
MKLHHQDEPAGCHMHREFVMKYKYVKYVCEM